MVVVLFKRIIRKIYKFFLKLLNSDTVREYHVTLLFKETIYIKQAAGSWVNIYGFEMRDDNGELRRWIGLDDRWLGIRVQDVLLEFKSVNCYSKWKEKAHYDSSSIINDCLTSSDLIGMPGDIVNIEWIFKWGDESKNFDIHLSMDRFAIEK